MVCKECGKIMQVYDTVKASPGGETMTLRRRRCPDHKDNKCSTIEREAKTEEDLKFMKILSLSR